MLCILELYSGFEVYLSVKLKTKKSSSYSFLQSQFNQQSIQISWPLFTVPMEATVIGDQYGQLIQRLNRLSAQIDRLSCRVERITLCTCDSELRNLLIILLINNITRSDSGINTSNFGGGLNLLSSLGGTRGYGGLSSVIGDECKGKYGKSGKYCKYCKRGKDGNNSLDKVDLLLDSLSSKIDVSTHVNSHERP